MKKFSTFLSILSSPVRALLRFAFSHFTPYFQHPQDDPIPTSPPPVPSPFLKPLYDDNDFCNDEFDAFLNNYFPPKHQRFHVIPSQAPRPPTWRVDSPRLPRHRGPSEDPSTPATSTTTAHKRLSCPNAPSRPQRIWPKPLDQRIIPGLQTRRVEAPYNPPSHQGPTWPQGPRPAQAPRPTCRVEHEPMDVDIDDIHAPAVCTAPVVRWDVELRPVDVGRCDNAPSHQGPTWPQAPPPAQPLRPTCRGENEPMDVDIDDIHAPAGCTVPIDEPRPVDVGACDSAPSHQGPTWPQAPPPAQPLRPTCRVEHEPMDVDIDDIHAPAVRTVPVVRWEVEPRSVYVGTCDNPLSHEGPTWPQAPPPAQPLRPTCRVEHEPMDVDIDDIHAPAVRMLPIFRFEVQPVDVDESAASTSPAQPPLSPRNTTERAQAPKVAPTTTMTLKKKRRAVPRPRSHAEEVSMTMATMPTKTTPTATKMTTTTTTTTTKGRSLVIWDI